jgi:uncharacterized membrane protein
MLLRQTDAIVLLFPFSKIGSKLWATMHVQYLYLLAPLVLVGLVLLVLLWAIHLPPALQSKQKLLSDIYF